MNLRAFSIAAFTGSTYVLMALAAPPTPAAQGTRDLSISLEGREWTISQYYIHKQLSFPHLQPQWVARPSIKFEDGLIYGSPGCGRFTGTYKKSGESLVVAAKWSDDLHRPCSDEEKSDAAKILEALGNVHRISAPPSYWHDDALLLNNEKGEIQVTLSPKKSGGDLSEFHDTYWRLTHIRGLQSNFADVVVSIGEGDIGFSTEKCIFAFPFAYETAGLKFYPPWERTDQKACGGDWPLKEAFESSLQTIGKYQPSLDVLTFFDKDHEPVIVLTALRTSTIENYTWLIARYFDPTNRTADKNRLADAKSRATIAFVNGRVEGGPGCGGWSGTYKLSGVQLTVDAGAMLAGLCRREEEFQSDSVVQDFKGNLRIEQASKDDILLRDEKGRARIELVPF